MCTHNGQALIKLELCAPLFYARIAGLPSEITKNDDFLLCYELNPAQSRSIEPDRGLLTGNPVFSGRKIGDFDGDRAEIVSLPAGIYLFTQCRSARQEAEWLDMAIEQQKDGLWERHKPGNLLYVRFLYEDGCFVTQLFRSLSGG